MNISKIIAAGALATSLAVAQEDAWPTDEQTEEQTTEQAEEQAAPAEEADSEAAEPQEKVTNNNVNVQVNNQVTNNNNSINIQINNNSNNQETNQVAIQNNYNEQPKSSLNGKTGFGIHGDFNYSTLTGLAQDWNMGDETDAPAGFGFDVGLRGRIPLVDYLQFVPEVNFHYAQLVQEDETAERKFTQMDLEIPLMMRATVLDMVYITAGVQITLNLSSDVKFEEEDVEIGGGLGTMDMSFEEDIEQKGFGFGIVFGAGFFIMERLSIDAALVLGLTDVYENKEDDEDAIFIKMDGGKQMTFKAGLGFWFM